MRLSILTGFSRSERIGGLFLCVLVSFAVMYLGVEFNQDKQSESATQSSSNVTRSIGGKVGEVRTMMSSLVGMHYASISINNGELLGFSETLRKQSPYVNALGRYAVVSRNDRDAFEESMSNNGLFNFHIVDINDTGKSNISAEAASYYPVSMLEPMSPSNLRMIGANLASVPALATELDRISRSNESLVTTLPSSWPWGGQLYMFSPVYMGNQPPVDEEERLKHFDGGFWIAANFNSTLDESLEDLQGFNIQIEMITPQGSNTLLNRTFQAADKTYLTSIYKPVTISNKWQIDSSAIKVTLTKPIGFSLETLAGILCALISVIFIICLIASFANHRRIAERNRQIDKDLVFAEREKAERTLNSIKDAIVTLDINHRIVHLNPAATELFGRSTVTMIGQTLPSMFSFRPLDKEFERLPLHRMLDDLELGGAHEIDIQPLDFLTFDTILRLSVVQTRTLDDKTTGHILVFRDISNEKRLTQKLEFQANHDFLTGCTNRYFFENKLGEMIQSLAKTNQKHAICYMDLDQFKVVNDTCGHRAGDLLLQELNENLQSIKRPCDILSRLGGDEFGLIISNTDPVNAKKIADKIYAFFQNYIFHHEDKAFAVRASIGVVFIDKNSGTLSEILSAADIACYEAKDRGRNGICIYSEDNETISERSNELNWLPHLQKSLSNDSFQLYVQSVASIGVNHPNSPVTHYEFLLRMVQEDGTEITPWQFIQAAERYDLMYDIDKWVIKNAIGIVKDLPDEISEKYSFSINLSGQSCANPNLIEFIQEQFSAHQVDPSNFWFELTETAAISHFSVAYDLFVNIRSLGAKVALDDFGSGLSSFGYLKNLPVDVIKIDGQFVKDIATDKINLEMVRAIHHVGRSMGIETVAEFVETPEAIEELINIGVNYAQGYHIGRPCPVHIAFDTPLVKKAA